MQPSGDSGDSSSEEEQNTTSQDGCSVGSAEAEERAYLRQVQRSTPVLNRRPPPASLPQRTRRASSRASSQSGRMSMMTAPTELRRLSISSSNNSNTLRPVSAASGRSGKEPHKKSNAQHRTRKLYEDNFDDSVNPWVLHPSSRQYKMDQAPLMQQIDGQQGFFTSYKSPMSTTSSSVTATQQQYDTSLSNQQQQQQQQQQDEQAVLGPATKRALEALQQEIESLNEKINELRKDLVVGEIASTSRRSIKSKNNTNNGDQDGWKWVFKAAVKHAIMNLMTASILLLFLYKKKSPIAHAILGVIQRILTKFKLKRLLINKIVIENDTNK
ncbi:hypothetical protein BD408DRAFT_378518 [Parasitella parasitica]|nr:hypothetical protein BD408DRAFT_378518 [Parasitella parasitica]